MHLLLMIVAPLPLGIVLDVLLALPEMRREWMEREREGEQEREREREREREKKEKVI